MRNEYEPVDIVSPADLHSDFELDGINQNVSFTLDFEASMIQGKNISN